MNKGYTQESMRKLNEEVYTRGIPVRLRNPYNISSETALNKLERDISNYSKECREDVVFAEWGQPFGGPSDGFRMPKLIDIKELQEAYRQTKANGIYPKLGAIINQEWVNKKRRFFALKN